MGPVQEAYEAALKAHTLQANTEQQKLVTALQRIYDQLTAKSPRKTLLKWPRKSKQTQGLYVWGGPGIGKTFLMNCFFDCLPGKRKLRLHFYEFMQTVHAHLQRLQGHADPLKIIAREFSMHSDIIYFDEFFVNDIADAMLLAGLLNALFERGIYLIATSNVAPAQLYKNGLQRRRFLPTIALLESQLQIMHLAISDDYRQQKLVHECVYLTPLSKSTKAAMQQWFKRLAANETVIHEDIVIDKRTIKTVKRAQSVIWFTFDDLCAIPRSQNDYLEIARLYKTVMLSDLPQIKAEQESKINYFIALIDILYDNRVNLIVSSAVPIEGIYPDGRKQFEFKRTASRLNEMHQLPATK